VFFNEPAEAILGRPTQRQMSSVELAKKVMPMDEAGERILIEELPLAGVPGAGSSASRTRDAASPTSPTIAGPLGRSLRGSRSPPAPTR